MRNMKKIDNTIEKMLMDTGKCGDEIVTVTITLTDSEKEEFLETTKYDGEDYFWELNGNSLTISRRSN